MTELGEETIETTEVFSGRLVKLRVDRVRLPNGRETTREIVVHPGAVTAVPLIGTEKIVMVRQFRQAAGETLLEIPAGTLEQGEDPVECARRELREEIGYHPNNLTLMFKSYLAPGYSSEILYTYLAEDLEKVDARSDPDEFLEIVEVRMCDAVGLIQSGEIKDAKTICGVMMAQRMLGERG